MAALAIRRPRQAFSPISSRGSRPSLGGPNSPVVMEHSGGSSLPSRTRVRRRHWPLAIAGAAALLAVAGFASRSTSDEPRRLSEIGNCLTSSTCPDVWEPVCAAAADHPNKANASTFELNSTHLYTYASACIAAECGTAVVQARATIPAAAQFGRNSLTCHAPSAAVDRVQRLRRRRVLRPGVGAAARVRDAAAHPEGGRVAGHRQLWDDSGAAALGRRDPQRARHALHVRRPRDRLRRVLRALPRDHLREVRHLR